MTEKDWQQRITDLCDWYHLKWHHETDSRKSKAGFPDLVIAGPGGVVFAELKVGTNRLGDEQAKWSVALSQAGAQVYLWYPDEWDLVQKILKKLAKEG